MEKEYGRTWIWTALDSNTRLIISFLVGNRTLEDCEKFIKDLAGKIDNKPLFVSDELPHYKAAILEEYHVLKDFEKTCKRGRPKNIVKEIDSGIDYAIVHKTRTNGKVVKVETRIVYGTEESVAKKLERSVSKKINTAYIERSNGTLRLYDSNLQRKTLKFAKEKKLLKAKIGIIKAYYNFVKVHTTLSRNKDKSETARTPAVTAGVTEKPWTIKYLLEMPLNNINN
jgi:IS1 family transposase